MDTLSMEYPVNIPTLLLTGLNRARWVSLKRVLLAVCRAKDGESTECRRRAQGSVRQRQGLREIDEEPSLQQRADRNINGIV